jgi:DnaA-homolog protein
VKQLALDIVRPVSPTLDNFVAGRNAELVHSLRALAAGRATERFIYIWGARGCGRSHLLRGFVAAAAAAGRAAVYLAGGDNAGPAADLAVADGIAVDDVQRCDAQTQVLLFSLYNALRERGGMLVVSGDVPPARLGLRQDLATRLAWGLVYEVQALSDDEKAQALRDHAAARGLALPDEVCTFLLSRTRRDMPSLLAVLDALDRHALETKRQITVPLVRELLQADDNSI